MRRQKGVNLKARPKNKNKYRVVAIGVFLLVALTILMVVQISPRAAFVFAGVAVLLPVFGMMYFFNRLGK